LLRIGRGGGGLVAAAHHAAEPELFHEPPHPVAPDLDPFALALPPDLLNAIDAVVVVFVYPGDVALEHLVVERAL
jgi:hypothetical protein